MKIIRTAISAVADGVVWVLLFVVGVECRFSEIRKRSYFHPSPALPGIGFEEFQNAAEPDREAIVQYVRDAASRSGERLARAETKLRTMLGLSGIVFALMAGSGPNNKWRSIVTMVPLVFSVLLGLRGLGVHHFAGPSISSEEVAGSKEKAFTLDWLLVKDGLRSINANEAVIDLIVEFAKASIRWLVISMLIALFVRLI